MPIKPIWPDFSKQPWLIDGKWCFATEKDRELFIEWENEMKTWWPTQGQQNESN